MKDALKKLTGDVEAELRAWLNEPDTKAAIAETRNAPDSGTFEVVITTENLDRYQEVISLDGWDLTHYRNNPVVLWGHDHHQLPVGIASTVDIVDGKMVAKGKFAPHPFAQTVRQLYDMGVLRATSVGFIEKEREGNLITKAELLEFSFVSVPANPYALSTLVKSGVSINEMVTKGMVFVEKEATIPEEKKKGAVQDEQEAVAARQAKWKNFAEVDDVIWAFMNVYFEPETEVTAFKKLLDETIGLLQKISAGEKSGAARSDMSLVREHFETLRSLSKDKIKALFVALEALSEKEQEPEGNEVPEEPNEQEKAFAEFNSVRKLSQEAVTTLGDILAEMRHVVEGHK